MSCENGKFKKLFPKKKRPKTKRIKKDEELKIN